MVVESRRPATPGGDYAAHRRRHPRFPTRRTACCVWASGGGSGPPGRGRIRDVRLTTARGAPLICPIVLALVAGAHGTEYASVIALERLIGQLDPARLSGTVIIVPLVNLASFGQKVAHVNPIDGKSMNRMYLGTMDGTQTDRCGSAGCSP